MKIETVGLVLAAGVLFTVLLCVRWCNDSFTDCVKHSNKPRECAYILR